MYGFIDPTAGLNGLESDDSKLNDSAQKMKCVTYNKELNLFLMVYTCCRHKHSRLCALKNLKVHQSNYQIFIM